MITIRSPLKKTLLLLTLTTLTIGFGTALEWDSPDSDAEFNDDFDLIVTNETNSGTVEFWSKEPGSDGFTNFGSSSFNSGNASITFDVGSGDSSGTWEFKANSSYEEITRNFIIDREAPSVNFPEGLDYVGDDVTVSVEVDDSLTGVSSVDASISGSASVDNVDDDGCDGSSSCNVEIEIDTSDLDDGDSFDLDVTADDSVGNSDTSNKDDIILDGGWNGDSDASVEWSESDDTLLSGFGDEDQDVDISFQPDTVSDTSLTCEVDGDEVDDANVDASDEEETASCEIDSDDYSSSVFDLTVEAEDEAGNTQTLVDGEELIWDTSAPTIDSLEQLKGVSTFNTGFDLDLVATDDASGIETLEYYFDASTDVGNGNSISLDSTGSTSVEKTFGVEPGDLGRGSQTVYVRVEDGAGETDVESFDFEYYPDAEADINLGVPSSIEVTSGSTKSFTLNVENGAPFFLNGIEVTGSGAVWDGAKTASDLESGDSVEKTITLDASNLNVGVYNLTLQTANYDSTSTVEVVVRATESQKQSIENDLANWESKKSSLEKNISKIGTLEESNENITAFTQKISDARNAVDNGEYYKAKSILGNVNSSFSQASDTYSVKLDEHKENKRNELFMILFGGVVLLAGGIGGTVFYLQREESEKLEEILPEDIELPDVIPEELPEFGVVEKVKELIESAEEEVEEETGYEFEGFN